MKIIRTSTIPKSIDTFCRGLLRQLQDEEDMEVVVVSSPGHEMDEISQREGVKTISVPMQRRISPFKDLRSLWQLYRVFRYEKPVMVHSMTPKAGLLSMIAAWIARVPVRLHTFTGLVFPTSTGLQRHILMLTDRITCACATHIIPEGEGVRNDLLSHRITRKPLRVLGHGNIRGIDLCHFDPTLPEISNLAANIRQPDRLTFIFIGRIVGDKGINELISAFTRLHHERPNTRLLLIGGYEPELDPINPDTEQTICQHPAIEAVGQQQDVRPWLAASNIFVFPSYREGFPNVVIEAGAMGLPSIVTDINGSREIISHGENGVIIPPRNTEALYSVMHQLTDNHELRTLLASKARDMIASRFEQGFVRNCLIEYYKSILPTIKQNTR